MADRKIRLVVLGSGGRLGSALARGCAEVAEIVGFNHSQLDLGSPQAVEQALGGLDFDVLVNCAALTQVDYCETHEEEAFGVNARAVGQIAKICSRKQAQCIHISTDYVFDGEKRTPYTETDPAEPISVYGASKRQGEVELLKVSQEHLAVRVSWVFGPERPSFVDQLLKRAMETDEIRAIGDKWSTPTYTHDAVETLRWLVQASLDRKNRVGGLLHLAQAGECTWREYGQFALDCAAAAGVPLAGRKVGAQTLDEMAVFVAKRPVYTVLATRRLETLTGRAARPWQEAVGDYVRRYYAPQK